MTKGDYSDIYWLSRGPHDDPSQGRCAMEWVSFIAGEPHSDRPACVDANLVWYCIGVNDALDDEDRQRLRPYLTRCIGTADDDMTDVRDHLMGELSRSRFLPFIEEVGVEGALRLLEVMLPTVPVEIPEVAAELVAL